MVMVTISELLKATRVKNITQQSLRSVIALLMYIKHAHTYTLMQIQLNLYAKHF